MSIESEDLDAAVAAGVLPQAQADALRVFVAERARTAPAPADAEDERFRFMTGFNDFFFAIGILLIGFGMAYFTGGHPVPSLVAVAVIWGLSELLVRRMRLVLPGILLALFFIFFVFLIVPTELPYFTDQRPRRLPETPGSGFVYRVLGFGGAEIAIVSKALLGTAAASLYYWRFRLPFALLPIAFSLVIAVIALVRLAVTLSPMMNTLLLLACGFAVFIVAMSFDLSDRNRVTRRSDCAFWLHLLAAPLIVHSLVSMVAPQLSQITNEAALAIIAIVTVLAVVAIAIDRRALLVSALIYIGAVIAYVIGGPSMLFGSSRGSGGVFMLTALILGAFVITLGVGWMPLRKLLLRISPSLARRLPPVPERA